MWLEHATGDQYATADREHRCQRAADGSRHPDSAGVRISVGRPVCIGRSVGAGLRVTDLPVPSASALPSPTAAPTAAPISATGKGVTIVIFDRGIDFRFPDFLNPDGTTRIKAALDMSGQNWCNDGNPRPTEYTEADFNAALAGQKQIDLRDAVGHGTATAGLAAGNGSALPDRRYAGVAPEADLIIVKTTSEGAPAHGDQPAEAAFNGCMDQALNWAKGQIDALGQPVVGLWNAGTQWGPIDGTSATSRAIAKLFPPGKPGWVWVASSGDEGGLPSHAGADYSPDSPAVIHFGLTTDSSYPTAWYSGSPAKVTVEFADGTKVGPVGPGDAVTVAGVSVTQYQPGKEFYPWTSNSGDHAVWMNISGHSGQPGTITFSAAGGGSGHVDLYGDVLGSQPLTSSINFTDSLADGRLNDQSSTAGAIVVADYVALDNFIDVDGVSRSFSNEGSTGQLWYRSSGGPTRDGRSVVDIAARGPERAGAAGAGIVVVRPLVPEPLAAGWAEHVHPLRRHERGGADRGRHDRVDAPGEPDAHRRPGARHAALDGHQRLVHRSGAERRLGLRQAQHRGRSGRRCRVVARRSLPRRGRRPNA